MGMLVFAIMLQVLKFSFCLSCSECVSLDYEQYLLFLCVEYPEFIFLFNSSG